MNVRSAEDTRKQYIDLMGPEAGAAYYVLLGEVVALFEKWRSYEALYGTDKETVVLLNDVAPGFFGRHQRIAEDDFIMHLARLLDPPKSLNKWSNVSLRGFIALITNAPLVDQLNQAMGDVDKSTAFVASHRNMRLAHNDREFAMGKTSARVLTKKNRADYRASLQSIEDFMNTAIRHYKDTVYGFPSEDDDADELIFALRTFQRVRPR